MAQIIINFILLAIFSVFFILNIYQTIIESYLPYKVGVLVYFFHRTLIGFNCFFMLNYALVCSSLISLDAFILLADIFYDIAVLFGYAACMNLVYQTTISYQIALKMKIDRNEAHNVYLLHVIIFCVQSVVFVIKTSLVAIYNTTYYSGFYLITCAIVLFFIMTYSWYSFFKLNAAIDETSASNAGFKSDTSTSFQIESFKTFLIYFTIALIIAFVGQLYNAYKYFTAPVIFFDTANACQIQFLAIVCALLSLITTTYFWKSIDSSVSPETLYKTNTLGGKNVSFDGRVRRSSISKSVKHSVDELEAEENSVIKHIELNKSSAKYIVDDCIDCSKEEHIIQVAKLSSSTISDLNN